jgi:hypothetical protein
MMVGEIKMRGSLWQREDRQAHRMIWGAALLWLAVACGGNGSEADDPPAGPVEDRALTAAATAVLRTPSDPDGALRAYQGEIERVLSENRDPEAAARLLQLSALSGLDAQTADAFAALEKTVDGGVYSASFASTRSKRGEAGLSTPLCTENVDQARTVVYFVNGVANNIFDALGSLHMLKGRMDNLFSPRAEFRLFYNASGTRTPEDECNYYGLALSDRERVNGPLRDRLMAAATARCGARGPAADLGEVLVQWLLRGTSLPEAHLVGKLRDLVLADVLSGKKVLLVAHSQGNLYVEASLRSLMTARAPDGRDPPALSVGAIAVASPITYSTTVHSAFPQRIRTVQVFGDIIQAVPGAPGATVENQHSLLVRFSIQASNAAADVISNLAESGWSRALYTIAAYSTVFMASFAAHNFTLSYLNGASAVQMAAEMRSVDGLMQNGRPALGQGFFQVTLTWNVPGDIDLHVLEPTNAHVYWAGRLGISGELDKDDIYGMGPENYFVCSPGKLMPGSYVIGLNNYNGVTGTHALVSIRAGTQFRNYTQVLGEADLGQTVMELVTVTHGADGSFSFSR